MVQLPTDRNQRSIESMDYSIVDAKALVDEYTPAFKQLDKYAEPRVIAWMIDNDHKNGVPATEYIDYMKTMKMIYENVAEQLKMPHTVKKETEFCIRCNYPKYKGEECCFCKK
jgi:hypothetical protein